MNHRNRLEIREDGKGEVQVAGLQEVCVYVCIVGVYVCMCVCVYVYGGGGWQVR